MITETAKFVHLKKSSENFYNGLAGLAGIAPVKRNIAELWGGPWHMHNPSAKKVLASLKNKFSPENRNPPIFKKKKV